MRDRTAPRIYVHTYINTCLHTCRHTQTQARVRACMYIHDYTYFPLRACAAHARTEAHTWMKTDPFAHSRHTCTGTKQQHDRNTFFAIVRIKGPIFLTRGGGLPCLWGSISEISRISASSFAIADKTLPHKRLSVCCLRAMATMVPGKRLWVWLAAFHACSVSCTAPYYRELHKATPGVRTPLNRYKRTHARTYARRQHTLTGTDTHKHNGIQAGRHTHACTRAYTHRDKQNLESARPSASLAGRASSKAYRLMTR